MSEPITRAGLQRQQLTPDELFRKLLEAAVRDALSWYPKVVTHASASGVHPETGRTWTATGRRVGPADLEVRVEEGAEAGLD